MKTATVRDVRQNFGRLLSWLDAGEEVVVTMRRKAVARIVPAIPEKAKKPQWPDFVARQKAMFRKKVSAHDLLKEERDSYQW